MNLYDALSKSTHRVVESAEPWPRSGPIKKDDSVVFHKSSQDATKFTCVVTRTGESDSVAEFSVLCNEEGTVATGPDGIGRDTYAEITHGDKGGEDCFLFVHHKHAGAGPAKHQDAWHVPD